MESKNSSKKGINYNENILFLNVHRNNNCSNKNEEIKEDIDNQNSSIDYNEVISREIDLKKNRHLIKDDEIIIYERNIPFKISIKNIKKNKIKIKLPIGKALLKKKQENRKKEEDNLYMKMIDDVVIKEIKKSSKKEADKLNERFKKQNILLEEINKIFDKYADKGFLKYKGFLGYINDLDIELKDEQFLYLNEDIELTKEMFLPYYNIVKNKCINIDPLWQVNQFQKFNKDLTNINSEQKNIQNEIFKINENNQSIIEIYNKLKLQLFSLNKTLEEKYDIEEKEEKINEKEKHIRILINETEKEMNRVNNLKERNQIKEEELMNKIYELQEKEQELGKKINDLQERELDIRRRNNNSFELEKKNHEKEIENKMISKELKKNINRVENEYKRLNKINNKLEQSIHKNEELNRTHNKNISLKIDSINNKIDDNIIKKEKYEDNRKLQDLQIKSPKNQIIYLENDLKKKEHELNEAHLNKKKERKEREKKEKIFILELKESKEEIEKIKTNNLENLETINKLKTDKQINERKFLKELNNKTKKENEYINELKILKEQLYSLQNNIQFIEKENINYKDEVSEIRSKNDKYILELNKKKKELDLLLKQKRELDNSLDINKGENKKKISNLNNKIENLNRIILEKERKENDNENRLSELENMINYKETELISYKNILNCRKNKFLKSSKKLVNDYNNLKDSIPLNSQAQRTKTDKLRFMEECINIMAKGDIGDNIEISKLFKKRSRPKSS